SAPLLGDREQPLVAFGLRGNQVGLLQHLQHRIDGAGAWTVGALEFGFQRLDDVIAGPRLLGDQAEHDQAQRAGIEHARPAPAEGTAAMTAARGAATVTATMTAALIVGPAGHRPVAAEAMHEFTGEHVSASPGFVSHAL